MRATFKLNNKLPVIVLTGYTSGLGRALHDLLSSKENYFLGIGRCVDKDGLCDLEVSSTRIYIEADFSKQLSEKWLERLSADVLELLEISNSESLIFINNAGVIQPISKALDLNWDELENAFNVNLFSSLKIATVLTKLTKELNKKLMLINITTGAANKPVEGWLAYGSSKAACKAAFDILAKENTHIDLVHYDPGVLNTKMQACIREQPSTSTPTVAYFRQLEATSMLKDPMDVAKGIVRDVMGFEL